MNDDNVKELQQKLERSLKRLREIETDKAGLRLTDFRTLFRMLYGNGEIRDYKAEDYRVALRREGWRRRRGSLKWFYEGDRK